MQTLTIRRDQAVPGIVFQSSHGYKLLVTKVIDAAARRTDSRHVQIEGHLHANPDCEIAIERYAASSTIEVERFDPSLLPETEPTPEPKECKARRLRVGYGVKADGAPAFSRIHSIRRADPDYPGMIVAKVAWGTLVFEPDALVPVDAPVLHPLIADETGTEFGLGSLMSGGDDPDGEVVEIVEPDESQWRVRVQWPEFEDPETFDVTPAPGSDEPLFTSDLKVVA
jgi:hypothetical protein